MAAGLRTWVSPGPVASAFYLSDSYINGIMGPVGSGKTSTCIMRALRVGIAQNPSPIDRVRRTRGLIIRDTYENAKRTVIPSWQTWFPPNLAGSQWIAGPPAKHILRFPHPSGDGTTVEIEVMFVGLGEHNVEDILRGFEPTWVWINEADLTPEAVLDHAILRVGRYPSMLHGGATWSGVWCDFNAFPLTSWCYRRFVAEPASNVRFFRQPGGLEPGAENLENLPSGYYEKIVAANENDPWYVDRMVHNLFAYPRDGKPVFLRVYNDTRHAVNYELRPVQGVKLALGYDAGRTPSCIIGQYLPDWRWITLDEIILDGAIAEDLAEAVLKVLTDRYPDWLADKRVMLEASGDPAASNPNDTSALTFHDTLRRATGIRWKPAPGNNVLDPRIAVIAQACALDRNGKPGFLVGSKTPVIREALNFGYRYAAIQRAGRLEYGEKPEKNSYSHPMDGLQYAMLGAGGYERMRLKKQAANDAQGHGGASAGRRGPRITYRIPG